MRASIVAWCAVALLLGARAAILTAALLLVNPGYGILFHGLASDALFAAAFAGWAVLLSRAILRPSIRTFLFAGLGMGALVLVRPPNQVLIVLALLPFALRAPWRLRVQWAVAFFVASAAVTQGWKGFMTLRYGDAVGLRPSGAVLVTAFALLPLLVPPPLAPTPGVRRDSVRRGRDRDQRASSRARRQIAGAEPAEQHLPSQSVRNRPNRLAGQRPFLQ